MCTTTATATTKTVSMTTPKTQSSSTSSPQDSTASTSSTTSSSSSAIKTKPYKILAKSQSRFLDKNFPSWLVYIVTFFAFPLNNYLISLTTLVYGMFFCSNLYVKSIAIAYFFWMTLVDRHRCDGVGYNTNMWPFDKLRYFVRNNWFYAMHHAYYPITLHKTAELPAYKQADNNKQTKDGKNNIDNNDNKNEKVPQKYLFACHPHGVIGVGTMSVFATDEVGFSKLFPGVETYMTGLRQVFSTPFFRDWCLLGGIFSSDKTSLQHIFNVKQGSAVINLGGAAEAFLGMQTNPKTGNPVLPLVLKERKGFCKVALQQGVDLVPVLAFEENLLFDLVGLPDWLYHFQVYLQKKVLGFAPIMVWGNKWPLMPKKQPLNVFVGAPISCPQIDNPTNEQIAAKHTEYCQALRDLFEGCKSHVPGCENWELELVDHPFKSIQK